MDMLDTKCSVKHSLSLTAEELHKKTVTSILEDDAHDMEKKLILIHSENKNFDRRQEKSAERLARLQNSQIQIFRNASAW